MDMFVVGDSNFYRNLCKGHDIPEIPKVIDELRRKEKSKSIAALMSTNVAMELIKHFLDKPESIHYSSCIKAACALYLHCGDSDNFNLLPSPETQIAKEYFGVENSRAIHTQQTIGQLLYQIAIDPSNDNVNRNIDLIKQISAHVDDSSAYFVQSIKQFCLKVDPNFSDWTLFAKNKIMREQYLNYVRSEAFFIQTAASMLCAVAMDLENQGLLKTPPSKIEVNSQVKAYIKSYKASLELRRWMWEQLPNHFNLNENSRDNFLWDEMIMHVINHQLQGIPVILLTDDKKIHEATIKATTGLRFMNFNEYLEYLSK